MKPSLAFLRDQFAPTLLCFVIAIACATTSWVERFENVTLDYRTQLRARDQRPADPRVVVIGIDDLSIDPVKGFGMWPWQRQIHGQFIFLANNVRPAVIAWDILFTEPDTVEPNNDAILLAGTKAAKDTTVIFGAQTTEVQLEANPAKLTRPFPKIEGDVTQIPWTHFVAEPLRELTNAARMGFTDTPPGTDGVRRIAPLLIRVRGQVYPSLSLAAVLAYWKVEPQDVRIRLGDAIYFSDGQRERRIPIDEGGGYLVNYRRSIHGSNAVGYFALVNALERRFRRNEPVPEMPDVTGKILLVGQIADGLADFGPTPFSPLTPLVFVHVNVVENILLDDYARRPPAWIPWLGAFGLALFGLSYFGERRFSTHVLFSIGVIVVYAFASLQAWNSFNLWLPLVAPMLGFVAVQVFALGRRVVEEQRAKAQIKGMFGTYISPELVNRMVESRQAPQLGGHEEEITAYFSDIQGYSTFSEKLSADKLVVLLNDYLTVCTDTITEEGGTLDKYIGDAVVAMFGAPIALPDHAYRACVAALRVQKQLGVLRERWNADSFPWPEGVLKMQSRIGLNTGPATIGNMGSRTRFNYTMTGDNVNLAARMESGAKSWGAYTMCTEATKLACEKHGGDRVLFRPLGRIVVMGRTLPVPIFEAVALKEEVSSETRECLGLFEQALARYYARDWAAAIAGFERSARLEPNQPGKTPGVKSNPSLVYVNIARAYQAEPPPENWDGVYVMKEK